MSEIKFPSLKIIDKEFLYVIAQSLQAYETYFYNEYGQDISFSYVFILILIILIIALLREIRTDKSAEDQRRELIIRVMVFKR